MNTAYDELTGIWNWLHRFQRLQSIAGWDQVATIPTKGNDARAKAMAEMEGLMHQIRTAPKLAGLLQRVGAETVDAFAAANLGEIRRG